MGTHLNWIASSTSVTTSSFQTLTRSRLSGVTRLEIRLLHWLTVSCLPLYQHLLFILPSSSSSSSPNSSVTSCSAAAGSAHKSSSSLGTMVDSTTTYDSMMPEMGSDEDSLHEVPVFDVQSLEGRLPNSSYTDEETLFTWTDITGMCCIEEPRARV